MQPPGNCNSYDTPPLGAVHDFFGTTLGLAMLVALGLGGILAAYFSGRLFGRRHAVLAVGIAAVIGCLLTIAAGRASTTVGCRELAEGQVWERWGSVPETRWGAPAYFRITQTELDLVSERRLAEVADAVFWSGTIGFVVAFVMLRRYRNSGAARGAVATFV